MKTIAMLLLLAAPLSAYTLHEWGTFTTVSGSDGVLLAGLEREEATLPLFTYSHYGLENGNIPRLKGIPTKGIGRRPVAGVTVKMETPVIYFHSDQAFDVKVKVEFNGGTISQWYPDRSGGETLPYLPDPIIQTPKFMKNRILDFSRNRKGFIEWQARVLSPEESRGTILFKPGESLHWMRPRVPEANVVRMPNGETEGFLFYRGIGAFDPGLLTTVDSGGTLRLENRTGGDLPFAFVFEKQGALTRWKALRRGLPAGETAEIPRESLESLPEAAARAFPAPLPETVYREMVAGLTATGLLPSEATAMVETWWDSYFATEGLRVFWVLPEAKTAAILPLEVTPAPEKQVRVLVGRSEVLRPETEQKWLAWAASEQDGDRTAWELLCRHDRFGLAYQRRVEALSATAARR